MKATRLTTAATPAKKNIPFFNKESEPSFFHPLTIGSSKNLQEFFSKNMEKPDESITESNTPNANEPTATPPLPRSLRADKCSSSPEFPNFPCLTQALKLDIDDNLQSNAYQFYRAATLFPGNNELMWNTFLRYGLGVNLLQTSFGFMGANKKWGTILSYGAGIGLKSYQFATDGKLNLDIPIPLGKGINLDIKFDLNTKPDKPTDEKVNTSIGISGHF